VLAHGRARKKEKMAEVVNNGKRSGVCVEERAQ